MPDHDDFPIEDESFLAELESVIGADATLSLIEAKGGTNIFIPATITPDHWLVDLLGSDAATKLCQYFAIGSLNSHGDTVGLRGGRYTIPNGKGRAHRLRQRQAVLTASLAGRTVTEIALHLGIHIRNVKRWRAKLRAEGLLPPHHRRLS